MPYFKNLVVKLNKFPNLCFQIPKKNSVLIFDDVNQKYIKKYIHHNLIFVIKFRNTINFFALCYSCIFFFRSSFKIEYLNFFLKISNAKLFISLNFNRTILYQLKKYNAKTKFIILQNGIFGKEFLKLLKKNKNKALACDYFFCCSRISEKILSKYITAKFVVFGTIKNNFFHCFMC